MFQEIAAALGHGEPLVLLTVVRVNGTAPCAPGTRVLVRGDGGAVGTLGGATLDSRAREDALHALSTGDARMATYHLDPEGGESVGSCGATLEVFIEPLRPQPRLIVAGSGYVAQALARLCAPFGWRLALLDDRSEFVRAAALPDGVETAVGELPELIVAHHPDSMTAVVIVTRGHRSDGEALRAALETPAGYVGMIGSPSKVRQIFRALLKEGFAADALERVHAPIGLDLGAETPDEIALSIAAELLMWRRGGSGEALRAKEGILARVLAETADATPGEATGDTDDAGDTGEASGDMAREPAEASV